jgi:hypothetical protein
MCLSWKNQNMQKETNKIIKAEEFAIFLDNASNK